MYMVTCVGKQPGIRNPRGAGGDGERALPSPIIVSKDYGLASSGFWTTIWRGCWRSIFFEKIVIFGGKVLFTESILELLIRNLWFGVCLTHTSYNKLFL
jgi:hypothetical protein